MITEIKSESDEVFIEQVTHIRYHRNGVGGAGFHVVQFIHDEAKFNQDNVLDGPAPFIGIVFEEPAHVAVLCLSDVTRGWRGDAFERELREAIKIQSEMEDEFGRK